MPLYLLHSHMIIAPNETVCVHRFRNTGTRSPNTNFGFIGHLNKIEHGAWIALSCTAPVCFAVYSREKYTPLLHYSILFSIIQYNSLAARLQSSTCTLFCLQKCANFSLTYTISPLLKHIRIKWEQR